MNKKRIKAFRLLAFIIAAAMTFSNSSMTVLAAGPGAFFDDSEVIIAYTEEDGEDFEEINDIDEYIEEDTEEDDSESDEGNDDFKDPSEFIDENTDHSQYLTYELDGNGNAIITGNTITQAIDLIIPSKIDGHNVVKIGYEAFKECDNLKSVTIPDSVTSIGNVAFYHCDNLKSVTIPDSVTSIGESAFAFCSSLKSVTIPDSVTSLGTYAFYGCSSLTSVTISNGLKEIKENTFGDCPKLSVVVIYP